MSIRDDMKNVWRYLDEKKRDRQRSTRIAYWLLIAALLLASAGILVLTIQVMKL